MPSKKHVVELFTKDDPWPVRLAVLVIWLIFLLGLVVHFCSVGQPLQIANQTELSQN